MPPSIVGRDVSHAPTLPLSRSSSCVPKLRLPLPSPPASTGGTPPCGKRGLEVERLQHRIAKVPDNVGQALPGHAGQRRGSVAASAKVHAADARTYPVGFSSRRSRPTGGSEVPRGRSSPGASRFCVWVPITPDRSSRAKQREPRSQMLRAAAGTVVNPTCRNCTRARSAVLAGHCSLEVT